MLSDLEFRNADVKGWFDYEETRGFCDYCREHGGALFGRRGYVLRTHDGAEFRIGMYCARNLGLRGVDGRPLGDPRHSRLPKLPLAPRPIDRPR